MERIYRILLIAVCAVGILFGLQYFLPVTAQYFNIKGFDEFGIPGLPSMPTRVIIQSTTAPLPLVTLALSPSTPAGFLIVTTATPNLGQAAAATLTPTVADTSLPASVTATRTSILANPTRSGVTSLPSFTPIFIPSATSQAATGTLTPTAADTALPASATLLPAIQASRTPILVSPTHAAVTSLPTFTPIFVPSATPNIGGPCNNILYPIRQGQGWLYQVTSQGRSAQVNMVVAQVSGQQGLVDVTNGTSKAFTRTIVDCDNGAILSFPSAVGGMLLNNLTLGGFNTQYVSGILAPSQASLQNANWNLQWVANYRLSGTATVPYQGINFNLVVNDSPLTLTCHTTGSGSAAFEPITVTAGTYPQALKVVCLVNSQVTGTLNGNSVSGTLSGSSTEWFGLNTGLLKMRVDSATISLPLTSVQVNPDSQVELLHFQPAP